MVFESLLNPILNPLLESVGYIGSLFILVLIITLLITLIYKYTTNQSLMKDLKGELKSLQKQVKELKDQPQKAMEVQKKMMQTNSKYMMHSFKPMLFTFLPIIIFFGWMSAHLGYYPILPGEEFSVTMEFEEGVKGNVVLTSLPEGIRSVNGLSKVIRAEEATWILEGKEGLYLLTYEFDGITYSNKVLISNEKAYENPITKIKKNGVKSITVNNKKVKFISRIPLLKHIPWINGFGWLGTYILLSIIISIALRKIMKIY